MRPRLLAFLLAIPLVACAARPARAQAPAPAACLTAGRTFADSLAQLFIPEHTLKLYQTRNYTRLDSLLVVRCAAPTVVTDTLRTTVTDTVTLTVVQLDTVPVFHFDTVTVTQIDTVFHFDTVVVHDTVPPAPPTIQQPVPVVTFECTVRPNLNYRCVFNGRLSHGPNGIATYTWTTPTEAVPTEGDTAVIGFTSTMTSAVVTLRVTDSLGLYATHDTTVVFSPGAPPPPPPPVDSTTIPPPPTGGLAELPRVTPAIPPALLTRACTSTVTAAQLQAAVNGAAQNEVLCLAPGAVFRGTLTLGARGDTGWVVVRTSPGPGQPAPGARVRPSQRAALATIQSTGPNAAVMWAQGAQGWSLQMLEIATDSTVTGTTYALVDVATPYTTLAALPQRLIIDQAYVHGWPTRTLRRCVNLQAGWAVISNSWIDECHEKGSDSQAISSWSGTGPWLIENNTLRGAGENLFFGGAQPAFHTIPSDITVRRNHIETPLSWKVVWTKKNLVESKSSQRVLFENNVVEGSWADGQTGAAIVLKTSASSSANLTPYCPWCLTADWTVQRNLIQRNTLPFAISGNSGSGQGNSNNLDSLTRRIVIRENWADSINVAPYNQLQGGLVQIFNNAADVSVLNNVLQGVALYHSFEMSTSNCPGTTRLVMQDNVMTGSTYPIWGGLTATPPGFLACIAGGSTLTGNRLIGPAKNVPPGFSYVSALPTSLPITRTAIDALVAGVVVLP